MFQQPFVFAGSGHSFGVFFFSHPFGIPVFWAFGLFVFMSKKTISNLKLKCRTPRVNLTVSALIVDEFGVDVHVSDIDLHAEELFLTLSRLLCNLLIAIHEKQRTVSVGCVTC